MAQPMSGGLALGNSERLADYKASHFLWSVSERVATITLNRPERKNPLTFESYAELRDLFRRLQYAGDVRAVVIAGAGENFCSGGDVHEIIGPLAGLDMPGLLAFTRMTGDVVKAMRACPQPIVAAVDGACAGAGAILAMASDIRFGTARSKTAFLFVRVGLSGADMGACVILPRIIGQGRASELLFSGRSMGGDEALQWGFFNRLCEPGADFFQNQGKIRAGLPRQITRPGGQHCPCGQRQKLALGILRHHGLLVGELTARAGEVLLRGDASRPLLLTEPRQ
jgi:enoyl-CoA hydratase/carnithine racemase